MKLKACGKTIKVAYLLGSLNRGGLEVLLLDSFNAIHETSIDPICLYRLEGVLTDEFKKTNVSMIHLKPRGPFDITYLLKFRKIIKKYGIRIIHAQQPLDTLYAYLACLGLPVKIVQTFHGYDFNSTNKAKYILKFIKTRTDLNIFVSNAQKAYYVDNRGFTESKSLVLYNGISFAKFKNVEFKSIRAELNIPDEHLLLGSVGNFNHGRDQMTICRFLDLLHKRQIQFSFVFAGAKSEAEPQYWDNCVQYCRDNDLADIVYFSGSRNDVPNLLNQLDAFIYSTEHDTFGIAIIEAIYAGIPVFVNNWVVVNEITENGKHAILYKSKNANDLLAKFLDFLNNKEAYIQKTKSDAAWAKEKYSIQSHIKNLEKFYSGICQ